MSLLEAGVHSILSPIFAIDNHGDLKIKCVEDRKNTRYKEVGFL